MSFDFGGNRTIVKAKLFILHSTNNILDDVQNIPDVSTDDALDSSVCGFCHMLLCKARSRRDDNLDRTIPLDKSMVNSSYCGGLSLCSLYFLQFFFSLFKTILLSF